MWPKPKSTAEPQSFCTDCEGSNAYSLPNAGLKLQHYGPPIKAHVGRIHDGNYSNDSQGFGMRTARGGRVLIAPQRNRVYMQNGAMLGAYALDTFFTKVATGLVPVTSFPTQDGRSYSRSGTPIESIIMPEQYVYPENPNSKWNILGAGDSQDRLFDFDVDDRGYVYSAYSYYGWGITKDDGTAPSGVVPKMMPLEAQRKNGAYGATRIVSLKVGSKYWVVVSSHLNPTGASIYEATNTKNPIGPTNLAGASKGIMAWAKNADGTRVAFITGQLKLAIYDAGQYVLGGSPILEVDAGAKKFGAVAADGANFYAVETIPSTPTRNLLWKFAADGAGGYTITKHDVLGSFEPLNMQGGDGFLAILGQVPAPGGTIGASAGDVRLIKVGAGAPVDLPLNEYFKNYYTLPPANQARPGYTALQRDAVVAKQGGKTYLIYTTYGMGDVYELQAGDSLSIDYVRTSYGTANPFSKSTENGPFYGDRITFTSAFNSSATLKPPLEWNFGNTENSANNVRSAPAGDQIAHQYAGLTSAGAITAPKTVVAKNLLDTQVTDTRQITLKVPTARIGVLSAGTTSPATVLTTAPATPLALVSSDRFTDSSDGAIEGHYASWIIDGVTTPQVPSALMPVGQCGSHTATLAANYGPYNASFLTTVGQPFLATVSNVTYSVRPFVATIGTPQKTASAVKFTGSARIGDPSSFSGATNWTVSWTLKNGAVDLVPPQVIQAAIGVIPDFSVPTTVTIPSGAVLALNVELPTANLSAACQNLNVSSESITLSTPQPVINVTSGCVNAGSDCTLTATSGNSDPTTGWTYVWTLKTSGGSVVTTGTTNPWKPTIATAGNYIVELIATKTIFSAPAVPKTLTVAQPACGGHPDPLHFGINVRGKTSGCTGTQGSPCQVGEVIELDAGGGGYIQRACDVFAWNFGDSSSAGSGLAVEHTFNGTNASYNMTLTLTNDSGPKNYTRTIYFGSGNNPGPGPGPSCTAPAGVSFTWSGSKGCSPTKSCEVGEQIVFTGNKSGGLQGCDQMSWNLGPAGVTTAGQPIKTFPAAGTFTLSLVIKNTAGQAQPVNRQITIIPAGNGSGNCNGHATALNVAPDYTGLTSGCGLYANQDTCQATEEFQFTAGFSGYQQQTCDTFEWNFDDGTAIVTSQNPKHTFAGSKTTYNVKLTVKNPNGNVTVPFNVKVGGGNPGVPAPIISISGPSTGSVGADLTFTATSDAAATTGWSWNFGNGVDNTHAGTTSTTSTLKRKYLAPGTYPITVQARNGFSGPVGQATYTVTITQSSDYKFLLPVVIHGAGGDNSTWRTDVQVFTPDTTVSATKPLVLSLDFKGTKKTINITKSTTIFEDFMKEIIAGDEQGPVVVTVTTNTPPQIWTRTYNVSAAGTFGQFIPAILLSGPNGQGSVTSSATTPTKYYLAGLRSNASRYRTNVGFVNPTPQPVGIKVEAWDDEGKTLIGSFNKTLNSFQLEQITISTLISNLPENKPFSLRISTDTPSLVAYASMIDRATNDPVFATAVPDSDFVSLDYKNAVLPGVGHTGNWRSDVSIFNPDDQIIVVDLAYYDQTGAKVAESKSQIIPANAFMQLDDLLRAGRLAPQPADGLGMLKVDTVLTGGSYPYVFSRTYFDKGIEGSYGQGIPGFAAARANVKTNKAAYIPAIRSDDSYYTNVGLVNLTDQTTKVRVTLLHQQTGAAVNSYDFDLAPNQSIIRSRDAEGKDLLRFLDANADRGSFKIEIISGGGQVWAFASVIDRRTADPEYVAAQ
ncbi:MAG TPA: PKD domain-containing protein [Thermoanaerobaculia bacterium]